MTEHKTRQPTPTEKEAPVNQPKKNRGFTLTNLAIVLVLVGWSVNFVAQLLITDYTPNTHLDSMLLAVLGFLLAGKMAGGGTDKVIPEQPTAKETEIKEEPR